MRASLIVLTAWLCTGCASHEGDAARHTESTNTNEPTVAESSATPTVAATEPKSAEPAPLPTAEAAPLPPAPSAMTQQEITALVERLVAEEMAKRQPQPVQQAAAQQPERRDDALATAEAVKAAVASERAEQEAAQQRQEAEQRAAAEAAERAAAEAAEQRAATEVAAQRRDDEALAKFLLLPAELDRVERIKTRLETDSIWSLTLQDLDFAAQGFAEPLLHDALYAAAERCDENIEMDVLARDAKFTPAEKIQLATMPPIERQQLLMFTEQLEKGQKTAAADRYIREYIVRYPFIRKMVLEHIRKEQPLP